MKTNFKKFPALMISGENDFLVASEDYARMQETLGAEGNTFKVAKDYNHLDLMFGTDVNERVYDDVVKFIKDHTE
jgi:alpha-beta hydrolase superfamily lysophospholipase